MVARCSVSNRPFKNVVFGACLCGCFVSACASLDRVATEEQRAQIDQTVQIIYDNRETVREQIDNQDQKGGIVFTNNEEGSIVTILYGDSPRDAWIDYVSSNFQGEIQNLPLPSSISETAAFIYHHESIGQNHLVLSSELDTLVSQYYDLASTMVRLGGDIQDIRDIVVLLGRSDEKQNDSIVDIKEAFKKVSRNFSALSDDLEDLSDNQSNSRRVILRRLGEIEDELDGIRSLINEL